MPRYTYSKQNNQLEARSNNKALKLIVFIAGGVAILTIFIQLYTMSVYATKGDSISKLELRKKELQDQNKRLNEEIAAARNIDYIREINESDEYVSIDSKEVKFLRVDDYNADQNTALSE